MIGIPRWKWLTVLLVSLIGLAYAAPNLLSKEQLVAWHEKMPSWLPGQTVNLGLDLQGGAQLLLQVDLDTAQKDYWANMVDSLRRQFRSDKIGYQELKAGPDGIMLSLRDPAQLADARKIIRTQDADLQVKEQDGKVTINLSEQGLKQRHLRIMEQSIEIVRRRIDESGTKEPVIARQGDNRVIVQLPGVEDPTQIKQLLGTTAKLSFHMVDVQADPHELVVPSGRLRLPLQEDPKVNVVIYALADVSGDDLTDARASFDQNSNGAVVGFTFNARGARRFAEITKANVGKPFAIVLDNVIISAPNIREPITGGRGQISGNFNVQDAQNLALLLRAGALPAPLKVVEERTVGPTLGADSIVQGRTASLIGMAAVSLLVLFTYSTFGIIAVISLLVNMVLIFACMSLLQATLTLPGIAGIVLTIGMAVDANVLIYERIREEFRARNNMLAAIDNGFNRALATVIDTNLTALISAIALFTFGTGPIRGFAVTLIVGVTTSLFCAVLLTRVVIALWYHFTRAKALPFA